MRILVVDDEQPLREALERALKVERYEVETLENGALALERMKTGGNEIDAIVLDVLMPGIDGLEVCRRLRTSGDKTPVLMLTARVEVEDRVAGLDAGEFKRKFFPTALWRATHTGLVRNARAALETNPEGPS